MGNMLIIGPIKLISVSLSSCETQMKETYLALSGKQELSGNTNYTEIKTVEE